MELILQPFVIIVSLIFYSANFILHYQDLTLLAVFILLNLLLKPIYLHSYMTHQKVNNIKSQFKPKLTELKLSFFGKERWYLTNTLYRQHNYHPVMDLKAGLILLFIIPFFLAVYYFCLQLSSSGLNEKLFFLSSLSKPDQFFSLGTWPINILPILMLCINCILINLYYPIAQRRKKIPYYILSVVFFMALYNAPASLTLFWLTNQILLLAFQYKQEFKKKIIDYSSALPKFNITHHYFFIRELSLILLLFSYIPYLNYAFETVALYASNNYFFIIITCTQYYLSFMALLSYYNYITKLKKESLNTLLLVCTTACSIYIISHYWNYFNIIVSNLIGANIIAVFDFWTFVDIFLPIFSLFIPSILLLSLTNKKIQKKIFSIEKKLFQSWPTIGPLHCQQLFYTAAFFTLFFIFIYSPLQLYYSEPEFFKVSLSFIMKNNITYFFSCCLLLIMIYRAFNIRNQYKLCLVALVLFFCTLVYGFMFSSHYSGLHELQLNNPKVLNDYSLISDLLLLSSIFFISYSVLIKKYLGQLVTKFLVIANIVILSSCFISPVYADSINQVEAINPSVHDKLMSYSKKKNIIILVMDSFEGSIFGKIINDYPNFKEIFKDFTWYKNTFSPGKHTRYGEIGIHGGEYYTPRPISLRKNATIKEEWINSWRPFVYDFTKKGYNVSLVNVPYIKCKNLFYSDVRPYLCIKDYANQYKNISSIQAKNDNKLNKKLPFILSSMALFKMSPYFIKKNIYRGGTWLSLYPNTLLHTNNLALKKNQLLELSLLRKGNVNSKKPTFKYFHNNIGHIPYMQSKELCQIDRQSIYGNEICALKEIQLWLSWLKKNKIYNNSYIVLVSDHGRESTDSLLAIKKYNIQKSFNISTTLMANFDVASYVCEIIQGCSHVKRLKNINFKHRNLFITSQFGNHGSRSSFNKLKFYQVNQNNFKDIKQWLMIKG